MGPDSTTICGNIVLEDMDIVVERIHDDLDPVRADTTDVPGRNGTVLQGITFPPRPITLECRAFKNTWAEFDLLKDELVTALSTGDVMQVMTRNHPSEYYLAYFSSLTEGDRMGGVGIGAFELEFIAPDPARYGATRTATLPSSGSVEFTVGGNRPVGVSISAPSAVRSSGSQVWGVRFDENDFLHIATESSSARTVVIDGEKRTATVAGATKMVTLDSDWPKLAPGTHTARRDEGTGVATITWQERSI